MQFYAKWKHGTLRCYVLGHCYDEHRGCIRCHFPDYAEDEYPCWDLLGRWANFGWRVRQRFSLPRWKRVCDDPDCFKVNQILWFKVGRHEKCNPLPF